MSYYKTTIQFEVLSEDPFDYEGPFQLAHAITEGDCSGTSKVISSKRLTGKQMAAELLAQGSDSEFFRLDEEGNKIE
jgi:hypothetical protein